MFVDIEIEQPLKSGAIAWSERLKEALAEAAAEDVSELDDRRLRQGLHPSNRQRK